jgi:hypothetical protein
MYCGRAWLGGPQQKEEVPGCCYDDFPVCCCRSFCLKRMAEGGGWRVEGEGACSSRDGKRYGTVCDAMLCWRAMQWGCWGGGAVVNGHGGERASERCGAVRCDERSEVGSKIGNIAARLERRLRRERRLSGCSPGAI